jgi:hypothetical protein
LEIGWTKEQVATAIGEPDYGEPDYGPKGSNVGWSGTMWKYYIAKREPATNLNDPTLTIFFDTDDSATWIIPRNLMGVPEKGSPSAAAPN